MRVLITGSAGFLGQLLAQRLLRVGRLVDSNGTRSIERLILLDVADAPHQPRDPRVQFARGSLEDTGFIRSLLADGVDSVFHLASVVSSAAEADLDLGLRVNLDGSRALLDVLRGLGSRPKLLFSSSVAVYGGPDARSITDRTATLPQSSYGVQKLCSELLIGDYSRRGLIDGRCVRFPTIAVRPGRPNEAASSFASGIIREPLNGLRSACPVPPETRLAIMSPRRVIDAMIQLHDLPKDRFGWPCAIMLPALTVSVQEMLTGLESAAGTAVRDLVSFKVNPTITQIVSSWPETVEALRANALGIAGDQSFKDIIDQYRAEYFPRQQDTP